MRFTLILFILVCNTIISCNSNKKNENQKKIPESKTIMETDVLAMVSEVYDTYQESQDFLVKGIFYPANFLSQDLKLWGETGPSFTSFDIAPNNEEINNYWSLSYDGIIRANAALIFLDSIADQKIISHELQSRLKAECRFNRGLLYFLLASNFGNVPILNNAQKTDPIREPKASQEDVFNWIIQDLLKAKADLPITYNSKEDTGRATKGAALAYLGESYMWLGQYEKAISALNELDGHYELMPNFLDIHAFEYQNNKESIFEIQFNGNDNLGWGRDNYSTFIQSFALPNEVGGTGLANISPKFVKSFDPKDTRARATVISPGQMHPDSSINISSYNRVQEKYFEINTLGTKKNPWLGDDGQRSGYYCIKTWRAPDPNTTASAVFSNTNVILIRYGQVLLDLAESKYRTGDIKGAQLLINKIRKRAGLKPDYSTEIMPVLINEYRHELAGEYSLWYVLRRSGQHIDYLKTNFNVSIPTGHDLLPIPQEQLNLNSELNQNIGY